MCTLEKVKIFGDKLNAIIANYDKLCPSDTEYKILYQLILLFDRLTTVYKNTISDDDEEEQEANNTESILSESENEVYTDIMNDRVFYNPDNIQRHILGFDDDDEFHSYRFVDDNILDVFYANNEDYVHVNADDDDNFELSLDSDVIDAELDADVNDLDSNEELLSDSISDCESDETNLSISKVIEHGTHIINNRRSNLTIGTDSELEFLDNNIIVDYSEPQI